MSGFDDPFDPNIQLSGKGCSCGRHASQAEHRQDEDARISRVVESTVMRALFPHDETRRNFIRAVGAGTALAAVSTFFPLSAARALAADRAALEKTDLKIGFVPITCATPIIMAGPMGFYSREGLNVSLLKTAGWAVVRDKVMNKEYDASHMLSPMPLAISLGLGSQAQPVAVAAIENINGQAITLHVKHKDKLDPKQWKGFKFGLPFDYSIHNLLLRYFLAEHGLDPDQDVELRIMSPPDMVANLRAGNIDGFLGPEPFNQRAVYEEVGFIHTLSRDIWDGHPCCAFGVSEGFAKTHPNTFAALFRAIASATDYAHKPENRADIIKAIAPANYLNQPIPVLEQVMTGRFADGLGKVRNVPDRVDFDPFPWPSMAVWMLSQLKRWGYLKGEVNYRQVAENVFLATDARKRLKEMGLPVPASNYARYTIMGKVFDPAKPEQYLKSFKISRA
ncbi:nitrate ABC transporter substrate-binding protein [Sulfuriferula plumbiphila]|uniref:Nitrate ABC transporter substrate-binding protein n=1 Tax=Sulfuriferula plumbiphila TaxID=171865 RepID=A0A512L379_9PROT|nr:CmpA/NrtA family ABC transporter substrate-binding protein [Sulfuriferula plumbiphila]BBP02636.1 nitrate ABC transporter substrate-binding protein [Sulfuriferula plumbiphila]GEP28930.1 nitrate ABC transporter substrate-binding protein [Sulfuriferula plumbiphila]